MSNLAERFINYNGVYIRQSRSTQLHMPRASYLISHRHACQVLMIKHSVVCVEPYGRLAQIDNSFLFLSKTGPESAHSPPQQPTPRVSIALRPPSRHPVPLTSSDRIFQPPGPYYLPAILAKSDLGQLPSLLLDEARSGPYNCRKKIRCCVCEMGRYPRY